MILKYINNILIVCLLTNPVKAGFDDVWRDRIARGPSEVGIASIYAGKALTCAHRTRPLCTVAQDRQGICPSRSYVTVRMAGKAVQCRVNDRGPNIKGRVIDLSGATARALGLSWDQGVGRVTLD